MKKYLNQRNIAYFSIILCSLGIIHELLLIAYAGEVYIPFNGVVKSSFFSFFTLQNVQLGFPWLQGIGLCIHSVWLLGSILFLKYGYREIRLLRFMYATMFGLCSIGLLQLLPTMLLYYKRAATELQGHDPINYVNIAIGVIKMLFMACASFVIVRHLGEGRMLQFTTRVIEDQTFNRYTEASLWQRLLHLIVDLFLSIAIFAPVVFSLAYILFADISSVSEKSSQQIIVYTMVLLCRFLYYVFFESIFSATPAKYLSESKTAYANGTRITIGTAFVRTICRFIPFEPFSAFSSNMWHDQISDSRVYKEQTSGIIQPNKYFWLLAWFLFLLVATPLTVRSLKNYSQKMLSKRAEDGEKAYIKRSLEYPSTDQFYLVKSSTYESGWDEFYIKIEAIKDKKVIVSSLKSIKKDEYKNDVTYRRYLQSKDSLVRYEISKEELHKGAIDLFKNGKTYEIKQVDALASPCLRGSGSASQGHGNISLSIRNYGAAGRIVDIVNLEDTQIKWEGLPILIKAASDEQYPFESDVTINGSNHDYTLPYKFRLIVEDSAKRRSIYEVQGRQLDRTIVRIE